jgi:hypothetical protein
MSRRLGEFSMSRNAAIRLRVGLRDDLENRYHHYSALRHPEDPRLFLYFLSIVDGSITHRFFFIIDDSTSPDDLFVVDFWHESDTRIN